jgi:hypothetical protein
MGLEAQIYEVDNTIESPNGEVNGRIKLVNAAGDSLPASGLPALPTVNGQYGLTVTGGVYTWTLIV